MEQILFILFLLITGNVLKYANFPKNFPQSLNQFIIYISLPATILLQVPKIQFNSSLILPLITPWIALAISVFLVLIVFKNYSKETKAALLLLIPLGNTSFFGFPMLEALVGEEAIKYGLIYDQFGTFLILAIYGSFILAYFGGQKLNSSQILKKIFLFPPFVFLVLALFLPSFDLAEKYLKILASTLTPLAIISVGFSMQLRLGDDAKTFAKAISLKLIIIPLIFLVIFNIVGFDDLGAKVTILELAMPTMITAGALAINAGFAPKLSASLVGYGIILAIPSLFVFHKILF